MMKQKESSVSTIGHFAQKEKRSKVCFWQKWSLYQHLVVSLSFRMMLVVYGEIQDQIAQVPYTDIDYRVVADGARYVLEGASPFQRHTYRYSPILAYLQLPNVLLHPMIGKFIYILFDIFVAILIHKIVRNEIISQSCNGVSMEMKRTKLSLSSIAEGYATIATCFWLYNPLTAIISTRGNGDCFSSFFIIWTLYLLLNASNETIAANDQRKGSLLDDRSLRILGAGCIHGFSIHLRLYPIFFSLAYYLCLSRQQQSQINRGISDYFWKLLYPNRQQLLFVLGTFIGFMLPVTLFYHIYGWKFLQETYLYHFSRRDFRHNFSLYFLMQYLDSSEAIVDDVRRQILMKVLVMGPQLILIVFLSLLLSKSRYTLPFCVFAITAILVTYNTVVTSQYFVWYLALLPLSLHNFHCIPLHEAVMYFLLWLLMQGLWLLPAYLLEFHAWNTFTWIGVQGMCLFTYHNFLLLQLFKRYRFLTLEITKKTN